MKLNDTGRFRPMEKATRHPVWIFLENQGDEFFYRVLRRGFPPCFGVRSGVLVMNPWFLAAYLLETRMYEYNPEHRSFYSLQGDGQRPELSGAGLYEDVSCYLRLLLPTLLRDNMLVEMPPQRLIDLMIRLAETEFSNNQGAL